MMARDEAFLRSAEDALLGILTSDARYLPYAAGLTAASLRNPRNVAAYRRAIEQSDDDKAYSDRLYGGLIKRVREYARMLCDATPSRPPWEEPPPAPPTTEERPLRVVAKAPTKHRRPTGFSQGRINQRRADLFAVHRYRGKNATGRSFHTFTAALVSHFAPRDLFDPDSVTAADLGQHLGITLADREAIEAAETRYRIDIRKWLKPGQHFRLKTVAPCDKAPAEVKKHYRRLRSRAQADRRKQARAELHQHQRTREVEPMNDTMQQLTATPVMTFATYAAARAAMAANIRAQEEVLLEAIGPDRSTVVELMERVRNDPAWRTVAAGKRDSFRRVVSSRLTSLKNAGRITGEFASGIRVVWRA